MKLFNLLFLVCTYLSFASPVALAQSAIKIGVVDVQKVILTVAEGKRERAKLEKEFKAKDKKLAALKAKVKKLGEALQNKEKVALMNQKALRTKQEEFQKNFVKAQQDELKLRQELKSKEQAATGKIARKVAGIVASMGKAKKLDLVFESNSSGIMHVNNPVDLTSEVIKAYDRKKK